jgi:hypothetical protein
MALISGDTTPGRQRYPDRRNTIGHQIELVIFTFTSHRFVFVVDTDKPDVRSGVSPRLTDASEQGVQSMRRESRAPTDHEGERWSSSRSFHTKSRAPEAHAQAAESPKPPSEVRFQYRWKSA